MQLAANSMPPPPNHVRPPAVVTRDVTAGHRVRSMTTKQLTIDTRSASTNACYASGIAASPDYANLLNKETPFECALRQSDTSASPCLLMNGGLACPMGDKKITPITGHAVISSEDIIIESEFRHGQPLGMARITMITREQTVHSYAGKFIIQGNQCTFVCETRLIDGVIVVYGNKVSEKVSEDIYKPLNGVGYNIFEHFLIGGTWVDGQPTGCMSCQQITDDATINYSGPLTLMPKGMLAYDGVGETISALNTGVTKHVKGLWDKGRFIEKFEEKIIISYHNTESANPPTHNEREFIGNHAKGTFSTKGELVDGKKFIYQKDVTTTQTIEGGKVKKEMQLSRTTGLTTINWSRKNHYVGNASDGVPDGEGKMTYVDKSTYEGCFSDGIRCGFGVATFPDGTVYTGPFDNDKRHGNKGDVTWGEKHTQRAKHRYIGGFSEDKRTGPGTYIYPNGKTIKGEWKDNQLIQFVTEDGTYTGFFNDQFVQLNGTGKFVATDGASYEGEWKEGKFIGLVITGGKSYQCNGPVNETGKLHGSVLTQLKGISSSGRETKETWNNGVLIPTPAPQQSKPPQPVPTSKSKKASPPAEKLPLTPPATPDITIPLKPAEPKKIKMKDYLGLGQFEGYLNSAERPTGKAIITHSNGTIYECEFNNGQLNASNTVTIISSTKYKYVGSGEMVISPQTKKKLDIYVIQPSGIGTIYNADGQLVCTGKWQHGEPVMLTYPDGIKFAGSVDKAYQPIQGVMTLLDGTTMKGQWKAGVLIEGVRNDADGGTYAGEFDILRRPHGNGTSHWTDGDGRKNTCKGQFKDGQLHGQGVHEIENHSIYEGSFENGKRHGQGKLTLANGVVINGRWDSDKLIEGTSTYPDGSEYRGCFDDQHRQHGRGELNWIDSSGKKNNYVGAFHEGQRHGQGIHTVENRLTYQGPFELNNYHGWGTLTTNDGKWSYKGYFNHGQYQPIAASITVNGITYRSLSNHPYDNVNSLSFYGEKHWPDGSHYSGRMKDGLQQGYGTFVVPHQFTYRGEFDHGLYHGAGDIKFATSGDLFQGHFIRGQINGAGIYRQPNGTTYSAYFTPEALQSLSFLGEMTSNDGYRFRGLIQRGQPAGYGTLTLDSGVAFDGAFVKRPN